MAKASRSGVRGVCVEVRAAASTSQSLLVRDLLLQSLELCHALDTLHLLQEALVLDHEVIEVSLRVKGLFFEDVTLWQ